MKSVTDIPGYAVNRIRWSDGKIVENSNGSCLLFEYTYPLSYIYGGYALGKANETELCHICNPAPDIQNAPLLFLDTETTGLSGGAGTYAFLIGTGRFTRSGFSVSQLFMRDFGDEPSMLELLNEYLAGSSALVTFNGKAFDWNLLQTRYISNRMRPKKGDPYIIDLLHPARRLWKLKLESCRLVSLEANILGEHRTDDIPGELIPSIYFNYLDTGMTSVMERVLEHNRNDILSMVPLMTKICALAGDPLNEADGHHELFGAAGIYESTGRVELARACYEPCAASDDAYIKERALKKLSMIYKRTGEFARAEALWLENAEEGKTKRIRYHCLRELAMYYEHRKRDPESALHYVNQAFSLFSGQAALFSDEYRLITIRHERLKRKISVKARP